MTRALGFDMSHYQTISSWSSVYSGGRQFVFVKATEGATYTDPTFASNMSGATGAGVIAGAYHYAHPDSNTATTEANKFLGVASSYIGAGYLKPVLDIEEGSLTKSAMSTWVNSWCNTVLNATGVRPIVYSYPDFATNKLDSSVTQWSPWMASYNSQSPQTGAPNSTAPWSGWSFWQYSASTTVTGVSSGACDVDVYGGDVDTMIANHVGKSSQFAVGDTVHVTASSLKAWDTYASNGTYVSKASGTTGTIQGGPVMVAGYLRWKVLYSGDSVARWSAGDYLASGSGARAASTSMLAASSTPATTAKKDKSTFASTIIA